MHPARLFPALLIGMLVLAACGGQPAPETQPEPEITDVAPAAVVEEAAIDDASEGEETHADEVDADTMASEEAEGDAAADADKETVEKISEEQVAESESADSSADTVEEPVADAVERAAWQHIALTNARTGEQFTLADYAGQTVFVEPFATWCGNCRRQLGNIQSAHTTLGDDAVFIALSVEPNIANEALVKYADGAGFEYIFAAMPQEMLQELAAQYGQTIANPPATPHFIIRPDGSTTEMVTGIEGPAVLVEQIQAARG